MWVVVVHKPDVDRQVVVGPFHSDYSADRWTTRIRESYPELGAIVEWSYSPARPIRDTLKEALEELQAEEPTSMTVELPKPTNQPTGGADA